MFRFLVIISITALLVSGDCIDVQAQGFGHPGHSHRSGLGTVGSSHDRNANQRYPYAYPIYGYGYVYDPYAKGSFRAPDLLNDPYFRAEHKFDSHFPGRRYSRRRPIVLRQSTRRVKP